MARATNKQELITQAQHSFAKLWLCIDTLPAAALAREFDFSADSGKKEAHWQRDKNLRDVLIHLYEWHQLLLRWVESNQGGQAASFLPAPYNWKNYGQLNLEFFAKHQQTPLEQAKTALQHSHQQCLLLAQQFSDDELFVKQHFSWTGSTSLGSYFVSALSSHYDWALKKLNAHLKAVCHQ